MSHHFETHTLLNPSLKSSNQEQVTSQLFTSMFTCFTCWSHCTPIMSRHKSHNWHEVMRTHQLNQKWNDPMYNLAWHHGMWPSFYGFVVSAWILGVDFTPWRLVYPPQACLDTEWPTNEMGLYIITTWRAKSRTLLCWQHKEALLQWLPIQKLTLNKPEMKL